MAKKATSGRTRKVRKRKPESGGFWRLFGIAVIAVAAVAAVYVGPKNFAEGFSTLSGVFGRTEDERLPDAARDALLDVAVPDSLCEQIVDYTGYRVSFNKRYRVPNYVAYELTRAEAEGEEARAKSFRRDESVEGCPEPYEYTRSGYDRGHMAPAADMKWSYEAMRESFYMTNICPQKHALNGGAWKALEEKVRDWAVRDSALIVVSGPIFSSDMPTIGDGVAVPPRFFKAVLAPFARPVRGIAFIFKNEGGQKVLQKQVVSIDSVEAAAGLDFFPSLPDDVEARVERSSDYNEWNN